MEKGFSKLEKDLECHGCLTRNYCNTVCLKPIHFALADKDYLFRDAIEKWGIDAQCMTSIGEIGELLDAMIKYWRCQTETTDDFVDELADAIIMTHQLAVILDSSVVSERIKAKLEKLEGRINK